jgi:hypothetical protein
VANALVEFKKSLAEVQDFGKITDHFTRINRLYPHFIKNNRMMSTYSWLDLDTL